MKAIVLRTIPFKENQKILTLFSEESGIVSMILKGISPKNPAKLPFATLFTEADFSYSKKNSEILLFEEGEILDLHLHLRNNLSHLQTAFSMAKALLTSQFPGKPSPDLYALLSLFLKQIPSFPCQKALLGCFYLKVLKHEGHYHPQLEKDFSFSPEELAILLEIDLLRSFSKLRCYTFSLEFFTKIEELFLRKAKI
jgi:DNA repair protein RecO (recombination protein O)